jgi:tRNA threonylcarbamoyl adenosine modification protein YeaZ
VLVLALDTSTDAVVVGLVDMAASPPTVLVEQSRPGARQHGEQLMPAVLEVCAAAGVGPVDIGAVVCGVGPGPFTGLRVGIASAAALADALGVPAHGVCSLDAVASAVELGEPLLVITDARRREVYWATYTGGRRTNGPAVDTPAALAARVASLGVRRVAGTVAEAHAELLGLPVHPAGTPTVAGLVAVAAPALRAGDLPGPLEPLYLRRPDAVPPSARKRVTVG